MMVREDTITELTAIDITKWVDRPTHTSVKTTRKYLTKKAAAIKTRYDTFPLGTRFCYAAAIMLVVDHKERVNKIEPLKLVDIFSFKPPEQPEAYDPSINGKIASVKVAKLEAAWETRRQDHEIYLGVEDAMKQLIVKAYPPCWIEEIEDEILEFTVKSVKEMLDHLVTQCLKVTNQEKKNLTKNTEFLWLTEEDVTAYFAKLVKEQVKLKAMGINWDDT